MASDESSLSSGSRLRQFGLYRSIDARTEEFLRLSRKRQLRQGCACAAASTAITVTIVIVIFFVYEFSLNSGTSLEYSLKSGWFSLMNDTSEDTSFDPKLTKANIDKTTLKLLPLLIKAIKKNAALENLLDDQSNISPFYDRKDSNEDIEDSYGQNSLTHSWLKMPPTKLYEIEYKTSPVVYYRDPTKNIEYYTKIRKIRDYQRVFNYVDKMISEKVYIRSSKPMQIEESHTESIFSLVSKGSTLKPQIFKKIVTQPSTNDVHKSNKLRCKCTHVKTILGMLLKNIQNLLPESNQNITELIDCKNENYKAHKTTPKINKLIDMFSEVPVKLQPFFITTPAPKTIFKSKNTKNTFNRTTGRITTPYKHFSWNKKSSVKQFPAKEEHFENDIELKTQLIIPRNMIYFKEYNISNNGSQLLRRQNSKSETNSNNILEPVFDGLEYNDDEYASAIRNIPANKNSMLHMTNKLKSSNVSEFKKIKSKTNMALSYVKKKKSGTTSKKSTISDLQVIDNKIVLVKSKPLHTLTSKTNCNTNNNYNSTTLFSMSDSLIDTSTPLTEINLRKAEEEISFDFLNFKPTISKDDKINILANVHNIFNLVTLKPKYFKYSTNSQGYHQTISNIIKNDYNNFLNKTSKITPALNSCNHCNKSKTETVNQIKKDNKTDIYLLVENHVNALLRKNISTLKSNLKKTKEKIQKLNYVNMLQDSNTMSIPKLFDNTILFTTKKDNKPWYTKSVTPLMSENNIETLNEFKTNELEISKRFKTTKFNDDKESLSSPEAETDDEGEFLITEITKPPGNSIYKNDNDTLLVKKYQDLTWEDLTNDIMPVWGSTAPDPTVLKINTPQYTGYNKAVDKSISEINQEDDFSINSNFYDLNL